MKTAAILGVLSLCLAQAGLAAEPRTEHTFQLAEGETPPVATLEDASWLVGSWTGSAFGSQFEQVWSAPSAGSMVGTFKLMNEGQVVFYEILLLTVDNGVLSLKVKHFTPEFVAWEEKADFVDFRLVDFSEGELHFKGLSFYRRGDDRMDAYIVMRNGEEIREEPLVYQRVE